MAKKTEKTNVMRELDAAHIPYTAHTYAGGALGAEEVAALLGQVPGQVFKTLVATGKSGQHYVFMVPSGSELDLKKAARAAGEKAMEMLPQKQLLPLTGYIHGGCSPLGMKRQFPTFIDASAKRFETICFSPGKVGFQVQLPLAGLQKLLPVTPCEIIK